ncbi:MAG: hypothetical protein H7X86_06295 [Gorillibacterium sp.]|nr:hypothetical protein [Gorillibacterium sp.]
MVSTLFIYILLALIAYVLLTDIRKIRKKEMEKSETITIILIHGATILLTIFLLIGVPINMPTRYFIDQISVPLSEWLEERH